MEKHNKKQKQSKISDKATEAEHQEPTSLQKIQTDSSPLNQTPYNYNDLQERQQLKLSPFDVQMHNSKNDNQSKSIPSVEAIQAPLNPMIENQKEEGQNDQKKHQMICPPQPKVIRDSNHYENKPIEPVKPSDIDVQLEQEPTQIPDYLKEEPLLDLNQDWWQSWEQEKKPKVGVNFQLYKMAKVQESVAESTIIGVIDQSGSMGDCFQWLATEWNAQIRDKYQKSKVCIFHNLAYEADGLQLDPEMGTTDVEAGFTLLNNVLNKDKTEDYLTVIFVSDGQDNEQGTIFERLDKLFVQIPKQKKINFLTIGVGEEFPTYLAMQLRQMYHTGENHIPPVFLVYNQHMHDNWKVTFNLVNQYLEHNCPVQTSTKIQKFPWYQPNNTIYENQWAFCKGDEPLPITLDGKIDISPIEKMTPQDLLELGSIMVSNIQLGSLKHGNQDVTYSQTVVAIRILDSLIQKWWGKGKKKKEEKEQLDAIYRELKDLKKDPDLKSMKDKPDQEKDKHLALKLAVGAIGAGIGLYWLSGNYGDFAEVMGGMDFAGEQCFGECGACDKIAQCMGCDSCGQCCGDIFSTGGECMGTCCKYFCQIMQYLGNFICGILGD